MKVQHACIKFGPKTESIPWNQNISQEFQRKIIPELLQLFDTSFTEIFTFWCSTWLCQYAKNSWIGQCLSFQLKKVRSIALPDFSVKVFCNYLNEPFKTTFVFWLILYSQISIIMRETTMSYKLELIQLLWHCLFYPSSSFPILTSIPHNWKGKGKRETQSHYTHTHTDTQTHTQYLQPTARLGNKVIHSIL